MGISAGSFGFRAFTTAANALTSALGVGQAPPDASGPPNPPPPPPGSGDGGSHWPTPGEMWDGLVSRVQDGVTDFFNYVISPRAPWGHTELTSGLGVLDFFTNANPMSHGQSPMLDNFADVNPLYKPVNMIQNGIANTILSHPAFFNEEVYSQSTQNVYTVAQDARAQIDQGAISDLEGFQQVLTAAAEESNNNPDGFMLLMNEVLLGDRANEPGNGWSFYDTREGLEPVKFGDSGVHENYQDHSDNQLSYHYWAYVNQGHMGLGAVGTYLNFSHEKGACGESIEDFDIGILGAEMGAALAKGELTPREFAERFPEFLATDEHSDFQFITSLLDKSEESPLGIFGDYLVMPSANDPEYEPCEDNIPVEPEAHPIIAQEALLGLDDEPAPVENSGPSVDSPELEEPQETESTDNSSTGDDAPVENAPADEPEPKREPPKPSGGGGGGGGNVHLAI